MDVDRDNFEKKIVRDKYIGSRDSENIFEHFMFGKIKRLPLRYFSHYTFFTKKKSLFSVIKVRLRIRLTRSQYHAEDVIDLDFRDARSQLVCISR